MPVWEVAELACGWELVHLLLCMSASRRVVAKTCRGGNSQVAGGAADRHRVPFGFAQDDTVAREQSRERYSMAELRNDTGADIACQERC